MGIKKFFMLRELLLITIAAFLFSGCGSQVLSHITTFHNIPNNLDQNKIKVVPFNKSLANSLEFQSYATTIGLFLKYSGFSIAEDNQEPDYIVFVSYGIDSGETTTSSIPIYGSTGGGTTRHSGSISGGGGYANYSGTSYKMPTYGIVGSQTVTSTQYTRNLAVDIVEAKSLNSSLPKKIYEGRVKSSGSCPHITGVMPNMIKSLFREFPGPNGGSRTVILPHSGDC